MKVLKCVYVRFNKFRHPISAASNAYDNYRHTDMWKQCRHKYRTSMHVDRQLLMCFITKNRKRTFNATSNHLANKLPKITSWPSIASAPYCNKLHSKRRKYYSIVGQYRQTLNRNTFLSEFALWINTSRRRKQLNHCIHIKDLPKSIILIPLKKKYSTISGYRFHMISLTILPSPTINSLFKSLTTNAQSPRKTWFHANNAGNDINLFSFQKKN